MGEKITKEEVYKFSKAKFMGADSVRVVVDQLAKIEKDNGRRIGAKKAEEMILSYRDICLKVFPRNVDKTKFNFEDVYSNEDIVETGETTCVPHHITQAPEILNMVNDSVDIFRRLKRPLLTTVATSRADRYLPDAQAAFINTLVLAMLRRMYPGARTTRTDIPENTADDLDINVKKKPLLYRVTNGRKIPVSRRVAGCPLSKHL